MTLNVIMLSVTIKSIMLNVVAPIVVPPNVRLGSEWPDRVIYHQLGNFWRLFVIFWKHEVAQRNGNF